jgi:hypothetical protein
MFTHRSALERKVPPGAGFNIVVMLLRGAQFAVGITVIGLGIYTLILAGGHALSDSDAAHLASASDPVQCAAIKYSHRRLICYDRHFARAKGPDAPAQVSIKLSISSDH